MFKMFGGFAALAMLVATALPTSAAVDPSLVPAECGGGTYDVIVEVSGTYNGSALREVIIGSDGDDTINGGAGNDCILGGEGNDTLIGGSGNDRLFGQGGDDSANGVSGVDICDAESETACEL